MENDIECVIGFLNNPEVKPMLLPPMPIMAHNGNKENINTRSRSTIRMPTNPIPEGNTNIYS